MIKLYIKTEQNHISVLHDVFLALRTHKSLFFCGIHASAGHKIVIVYNLCPDKAAFKIAVDFSGSLRCLGAYFNGPCSGLEDLQSDSS